MPRYFEKITEEALDKKIVEAYNRTNVDEDEKIIKSTHMTDQIKNITSKVFDDLKKVSFDTENVLFGKEDRLYGKISGFHTLENGLTFLGVTAGGDWKVPVFFIIYWDGKELRGYIPKDGNTWNYLSKKAFENDESSDRKFLNKHQELWNDQHQHFSIMFRDDDKIPVDNELYHKIANTDKILKDIQERILPKPI